MKPDDIRAMDRSDPLAPLRARFILPQDRIYLDGNSLGPLSVAARERVRRVVDEQWGEDLVESWNSHQWIDLPLTTGDKIASLLGARAGQVVCCDSVSVNLFKLLNCALQLQPGRCTVLSQTDNFPTDIYMIEGLERLLGAQRCNLRLAAGDAVEEALSEQPAVLLLTQVNFRSGALHDIERLTRAAHAQGTLVIWDLAHSAGVLPLELDAWQVDFAVGCGYKYLNGGPGAPAFLYVAERHIDKLDNPLCGWMGHKAPFAFDSSYSAGQGIARFRSGTPAIISLSCLDAAMDVFTDVSVEQLRVKSCRLTELFLTLKEASPHLGELQLASPRDSRQRGSHLAFSHDSAYSLCRALATAGVIADFRSPDILRFGFSPLFLRFADIWRAIGILTEIVSTGRHRRPELQLPHKVT